MRTEIKTSLCSVSSPQDNDLYITFDVTASAKVRVIGQTWNCPGELLVEDIEIEAVHLCHLAYGDHGGEWLGCENITEIKSRGDAARLAWLNSQLDDHDEWTGRIREAVIAKHQSELAHT